MNRLESSVWVKVKLAALATITVIIVNVIIPSNLNGFTESLNTELKPLWKNDVAKIVYEARTESSVFRRRPLVLEFQSFTNTYLSWPYQFSFNVINTVFIFAFFLLMLLWSDALLALFNRQYKPKILILWLLCILPVSCAYFATIFTYDDFLQYTFLTAALILYFQKRIWLTAMLFFLSCLSRETSLLFLPFFLFYSRRWRENWIKEWLVLSVSLGCYILFLALHLEPQGVSKTISYMQRKRIYAWQSNFENLQKSREALTVGTMMAFFPLYLLQKQLRSTDKGTPLNYLVKAAIGLIIGNIVIVYLFALARESRLFFIPLILATPLVLEPFERLLRHTFRLLRTNRWQVVLPSVFFGLLVGGWFYTPSTVGTGYLFKAYAVIYYLFVGVVLSLPLPDFNNRL